MYMYTVDPDRILRNSISSIETTAVSSAPGATMQLSGSKPLCFSTDWKPEPSFLGSQQVLALCGANQPDLADELIHLCQDLELLIFSYISGTLKDIKHTIGKDEAPYEEVHRLDGAKGCEVSFGRTTDWQPGLDIVV